MTNRVHIDAPSGIVELEGEKDFVEGMLAKLFPLIESAGFGSRPQSQQSDVSSEAVTSIEDTTIFNQPSEKTKAKRRRTSNPPKGQSCADRILSLKSAGFFKTHRSAADIVVGLREKGWTHKSNQVGAATNNLFERNELQRTKDGNGPWSYYWDRD